LERELLHKFRIAGAAGCWLLVIGCWWRAARWRIRGCFARAVVVFFQI
jgi:hypothetical protein